MSTFLGDPTPARLSAQIFAGIAGAYDDAVGPWKANLGILLRRDDPAARPG